MVEKNSAQGGGAAATPPKQRTHPSHFPNVERPNTPIVIFLTVCTKSHEPLLANEPVHELLKQAWQMSSNWLVGKYLIMPDHMHLFCSPAEREAESVGRWASFWKSLVARGLKGAGPLAVSAAEHAGQFWQRDCWDTQIRDARHYGEKWSYVELNPVRKNLIKSGDEWPFKGELNVLRM